ncbi:unnamed protein product [Meloidogyne enterolobii]|uniref:Uncharacterized protein n=1 Tax=Meloidogyne enterolobii TaxID=390850 RepID=A0ACB0YJ76_MELEN
MSCQLHLLQLHLQCPSRMHQLSLWVAGSQSPLLEFLHRNLQHQ